MGLQYHPDTFAQFGKLANTQGSFCLLTPRIFRGLAMLEIAIAFTARRSTATTVQLTSGIVEKCRLLTGGSLTRLRAAPPAGPIWTKKPFPAHYIQITSVHGID